MQLVRTKLFVPPSRPDLVPRPHLVDRLNAGLTHRLTVVCAPAGFGKSTAVSQWSAQCPSVAWVSLDAGDNDAGRFLTYLIAAVQQVLPGVGESALAMLRTPPVHLETVATTLINEWAMLEQDLVIVLDDFHEVTDDQVHGVLTFLLDHLPAAVHLIILTRSEPPFPLARLRVKGHLIEVRADDLRFTSAETALFFRQRAGLQLTDAELDQLEARSEGWVAGLQVAALSLAGHTQMADLLAAFTGNHRFVFDYLAEEVFRRQPEWVQAFLLRTALLDRMTGPLCDAVTGEDGGDATLAQLDEANLFVVPLDSQRRWYRYHHLFAEFLQGYLKLKHPHWITDLHRHAAAWYSQAGFGAEAISHWLQAGEYIRAADLVEQMAREMFPRGEVSSLLRWLDAIPADVIRSRERLCLCYAWAYVIMAQPSRAVVYIDAAERVLPEGDSPGGLSAHVRGEMAGLRALTALAANDYEAGAEWTRAALGLVPEDDLFLRSVILQSTALTDWYAGRVDEAIQAFHESGRVSRLNNGANMAIGAYTNEARLQIFKGRLREAAALFQQALATAAEQRVPELPALGGAHVGLGTVLLEQNDLDGAEAHLKEGIERCARFGLLGAFTRVLLPAHLMVSRLRLARGDFEGAAAALAEAEEAMRVGDLAAAETSVAAWRAHLALLGGDLTGAGRWADELPARVPVSHRSEFEYFIYSRIMTARGRHAEAIAVLESIVTAAEESGRAGGAVRGLVRLAMALQAGGDRAGAVNQIHKAMSIAEQEQWIRIFLDEGAPMAGLLAGLPGAFARRLLDLLGPAGAGGESPADDRLSEREIEVLRLLAEGLSNQEVARRLVVTEGTAKWHVHNIYSKLDVKSRTQAVARAREIGLID